MGLLRKLLGRKPKAPKPPQNTTKSTSIAPAEGTATYVHPNPFPDEETFAAVKAHVLARARENATNPEYIAMQRIVAFSSPTMWLEANYPPEEGHAITQMGPLPTDSGEGVRVDKDTLIPCDDTMFYMVLKRDPEGEKPGVEMKMLFFVAIPPQGCGKGEFAGTPMAYDTLGTAAMEAVEREVLWFVRKWQQEGPEGRRPEDGVRVVVQMGMDMLVWEYSREKGFYDPEGGFEFREVRDGERWERDGLPMPPTVVEG